MAGAALCLGRRVGHRASFPHESFARRQDRYVAYHSDAYCQYTENPRSPTRYHTLWRRSSPRTRGYAGLSLNPWMGPVT